MAKKIMIQGTMSNSGKSFVAAALCRILRQDGYSVAPFKSQNMALNSYITKDGLEIGRAQAMQAEAAGIAPTVDMNPILLKPTSQMGSQVIVNGEVFGNLRAMDYYRRKTEFIPAVREAFERLESQFDAIVLEGAGSPAEINLKKDDIVNMGMAKLADAPVLLVGDIDRGGVFAQIAGTVMLLEEDEKARIKGTIINKFRGDVSILEPGLRMLEEKTDIPVTGVVPYFYLDLDEEDSLTERFQKKEKPGLIDLAVIRFPRISNFTDLAPRSIGRSKCKICFISGRVWKSGCGDPSGNKEYDQRSSVDASERTGSKSSETQRAEQTGLWNLWRIPDAWNGNLRSNRRRVRRNCTGNGTFGYKDRVPSGKTQNQSTWNIWRDERNPERDGGTSFRRI